MTKLQEMTNKLNEMRLSELVAEAKKIKDQTGINHISGYTSMKKSDLLSALITYYKNEYDHLQNGVIGGESNISLFEMLGSCGKGKTYINIDTMKTIESIVNVGDNNFNENNAVSYFKNQIKGQANETVVNKYREIELEINDRMMSLSKEKKNSLVSKWQKQLNIINSIMKHIINKDSIVA